MVNKRGISWHARYQMSRIFRRHHNIRIKPTSLQEHNKRLTEVLQRLRKHNLKQVEKCEFLRKKVIYLGHIISEDGMSPDPAKLSAVKNFPTSKKVKKRPILHRTS